MNVRTTTVTQQPFTETVGALGAVEASAGHIALLSAPAPTRVLQVLVAEGQRVARGSTLVVLEQTPFREAERSAAAKLNAAQRAYDRARTLSQAGILPRKDVEQAAADLAAARADLVAARRLTQLSVLRAPISGVVTRMSALLGASVDTNEPLVEIADPSALEVILGMTPADAGKVRIGNKVALRAGQNRSGEMLGTGTVKSVGAVVDSVSRNVSVRVVPPTTSRPMRIGETVYGDVAVATRAAVIVVPVEALVPEGDQFRVFIIDAKNVVHARPVIIGARDPRIAEVRSGLTAGERIVTYGAYGLEDGATVVPARQ
ncbi:MAG: efflux RND transporter periplasmic adaptor subunit [Gemmatimonadales bacterium]